MSQFSKDENSTKMEAAGEGAGGIAGGGHCENKCLVALAGSAAGEPVHSHTWLQLGAGRGEGSGQQEAGVVNKAGGGERAWVRNCRPSSQWPRRVWTKGIGSSQVWLPSCLTFSPNLISGPLDSTLRPHGLLDVQRHWTLSVTCCSVCLTCCSHYFLPLLQTQSKCSLLQDAFPASLMCMKNKYQ